MAALLKSGDHIVSSSSVFGATHSCLSIIFQSGILKHPILILISLKLLKVSSHQYKDSFAESPTNPAVDRLELLGKLPKNNLILIIDNCFATPYLQQPMKWGALVVHSATKLMDGQGRFGRHVGDPELIQKIYLFSRLTGPLCLRLMLVLSKV
jgi:O-succinylhomoserine sulfhydrylase